MMLLLRLLGRLLLAILWLGRWLVIAALLIALAGALAGAVYAAAMTGDGQRGFCMGLLLGALLGPARIAGVDFRQWLRDPATPSEMRDDTAIGLMRGVYHLLAGSALLTLLAYILIKMIWREGFWAGLALAGGALVAVLLMQAASEMVWRLGLWLHLPAPGNRREVWFQREPPLLPPRKARPERYRRLIICCDGTWNWPESRRETNVVRLLRAITPEHDRGAQIVHYHQGVGTGNLIDRIVGGGSGVGLSASVKACYGFLVDNYREGDEIFLFGFSRGAYVVRALGGMIGKVGLLNKWEMDRFSEAWDWYWRPRRLRRSSQLDEIAPARRKEIEIECIGVWDTVGALGIPGSRFCAASYAFHDTELGTAVRHAFQALAIDERRGNFQAAVWMPSAKSAARTDCAGVPQVLRQMWFPGVHSNIGGGYPEHGLSDTALLWMLAQLEAHQLLALDRQTVADSLDRNEGYPGGKLQDSRSLFWKLLGCPMPRPVGFCSHTELIHDSVRKRTGAAAVPQGDVYKHPRRAAWAAKAQNVAARGQFEADLPAMTPRARPNSPKLALRPPDFCTRILRQISPKG
jgi:hypothetical protein